MVMMDMFYMPAEVSDQNFVDEEIRGENASGICSSEKDKNVDN